MPSGKNIFKSRLKYELSKIAPKNTDINIKLKSGLQFVVRARTMDRSVIKEVWMMDVYDKFGIRVEKGDTVIDIGAHIGVFSIYAAELSQTGKVFAFEPFIENFKRLEHHKKINNKTNLSIYNKGVSDKTGKQTLHLSPDNNTGGHSLHLKNNSSRTVEIETIFLPEFCAQNKIEKIDFLKLDCEGAEFEILNSSKEILNKVNKIIMECHPYGTHTVNEMIALLEAHQFDVKREIAHKETGIEILYARRK